MNHKRGKPNPKHDAYSGYRGDALRRRVIRQSRGFVVERPADGIGSSSRADRELREAVDVTPD